MSGQIIPFQRVRFRVRAPTPHACRHLNDPARPVRSQSDFAPAIRNRRILKLQVARIAQLLDELEELARTSKNLPLAIASQAHADIERARKIISQPCSESRRNAGAENDTEDDPQPDVDGDMLERMYRELNPDA